MLAFCHLRLFLEVLIISREIEIVIVQRSEGALQPSGNIPGTEWPHVPGQGGQPRSRKLTPAVRPGQTQPGPALGASSGRHSKVTVSGVGLPDCTARRLPVLLPILEFWNGDT